MNRIVLILTLLLTVFFYTNGQEPDKADYTWGNAFYYNLNVGDSIEFNQVKITLHQINGQYNLFTIGGDTLKLKVSRRTIPQAISGIRIFVADNKNVKALTSDSAVHGLLEKDALVCLSDYNAPLLNERSYIFPVSYNDGFLWNAEEDSYMFSYLGRADRLGENYYRSHEGIDIDLHDARGIEKHWILAIENSSVAWIEDNSLNETGDAGCVLLKSESQPGIYYVYNHLYNKNIVVKKGQRLLRGEPIGTVWGDEKWGHLHFTVVKSDTIPDYKNRYNNALNFFPQLYELYFNQSFSYFRTFSRGRIDFGRLRSLNGNEKNVAAFEDFSGKGWVIGSWNSADKVEWICNDTEGNARLKKVMFEGTKAEATNPNNFYDYEIKVTNGVYRIRAKVGDLYAETQQGIQFEGIDAGNITMGAGETKWTAERVVKVNDGKLTVRIFVDPDNNYVAGINEIVFQKAY